MAFGVGRGCSTAVRGVREGQNEPHPNFTEIVPPLPRRRPLPRATTSTPRSPTAAAFLAARPSNNPTRPMNTPRRCWRTRLRHGATSPFCPGWPIPTSPDWPANPSCEFARSTLRQGLITATSASVGQRRPRSGRPGRCAPRFAGWMEWEWIRSSWAVPRRRVILDQGIERTRLQRGVSPRR